ncbi:patatin-like phospholipase family protein [Aestuariibacter sp. AA17]|uniref:Patatin-like phospholipase family protein n=1 Tax=Fluctibacter corallii TaxID=2984329 RepID=A0ABT3A906_9ALTE|nr:patatin-like phospholipase family protein [Aestuariibacter sp. AA17]MCV2885164.1 patatin-like phospholipase family protein [Aestuariibacter sp. AA17]
MALINIFAGNKAFKHIKREGFHADMFRFMLGASGGPKWFVLAGLDRYIFPEFFANRSTPLDIVGSSAGAFRFACFSQHDPLGAINRLADRYSHTVYSDKPTAREITQKGMALLDYVLQEEGVSEIVNNPNIHAHFVVARCRGLTQFELRPLQLAGLAASAGANLVKRRWLQRFYQRYVFSNRLSTLKINDPEGMPTHKIELTNQNLKSALMASGSIPVVIEGIRDIPGAPPGMYRDGGIIDYHFDLKFTTESDDDTSLVLYPHFYANPAPGWFDKSIKSRKPHASSYENVVMVVPSPEFVRMLPYHKIPDRKDFEQMPAPERIAYWQKVLHETDRLGEAFKYAVETQQVVDEIQPLPF